MTLTARVCHQSEFDRLVRRLNPLEQSVVLHLIERMIAFEEAGRGDLAENLARDLHRLLKSPDTTTH